MKIPRIKSTAVLIGYDPSGKCVYSEILRLSDYYERDHVWDSAANVKKVNLQRITIYLFDAEGELDQQIESHFNPNTGTYEGGHTRFADTGERLDDGAE